MKDPYKNLYKLSLKGAKLQTKNLIKAEKYFIKIDEEIISLRSKSLNFKFFCRNKIYNSPVKMNEVNYFRPFFKMETHRIITEAKADDTHAIDLDVPNGTNVYAAESGYVTALQNESSEGGNDEKLAGKDNYIYIYNKESNLIFCYRHLEKFNNISLNDFIEEGKLIGKTGITGYVITPHLHFVIYEFNKNNRIILKSLPIQFI